MIKVGVVLLLGVVCGAAVASGFKCETEDGLRVKLFNHIDPETGTRLPAALIISRPGMGTMLVRENDEIRKRTLINTVRYTVDGTPDVNADLAILQVRFVEGTEELGAGESTPGQLIFVRDGEKTVSNVMCTRYLKQPNE
jgi:hypothetical protein